MGQGGQIEARWDETGLEKRRTWRDRTSNGAKRGGDGVLQCGVGCGTGQDERRGGVGHSGTGKATGGEEQGVAG